MNYVHELSTSITPSQLSMVRLQEELTICSHPRTVCMFYTDTKFSKSVKNSKADCNLLRKRCQIQHFMNMYPSFLEVCIFLYLTEIQRNVSEVKATAITFGTSSECQATVLVTLQCARMKSRQCHDPS